MNEPLSSCCNAPLDDDGYCQMCGNDEYGGFIDLDEDEYRTGHEDWEIDPDMGDH